MSDLIFASIKAGHYVIIENNAVVANIRRERVLDFKRSMWQFYEYVLRWSEQEKPEERFKTLADIHDRHQFKNYAGYGRVLDRKTHEWRPPSKKKKRSYQY